MALHKSSRLLSVGELAPLAAGAFSSWSFCRSRSHRPLFDRHSISVLAVHLDPMDGVAEDVLAGDARVARHVISCRSLKKDVVTSSVLIRLLVQLVDRLLDELIAATKVKAAALDVALKGLFLRQFSPCLLRNPLLDLCGVFPRPSLSLSTKWPKASCSALFASVLAALSTAEIKAFKRSVGSFQTTWHCCRQRMPGQCPQSFDCCETLKQQRRVRGTLECPNSVSTAFWSSV